MKVETLSDGSHSKWLVSFIGEAIYSLVYRTRGRPISHRFIGHVFVRKVLGIDFARLRKCGFLHEGSVFACCAHSFN